ncbi:hypothetical protein SAMN02745181_2410 [Rubritalea squalenifaciens DSM 18772]|uniref:Uncharacterized protein n=1 Tax=Rubritalea squalenifaciens DSM 18772 TaxID=1123071 RepID=A0A1M6LIZ7_9BACT|nr:hypothetical protein [Rubritalea squalenifaciens]SHJ71173.1 hypothetical protein SAMN02745181_2410 [Rubritalea squalenifaciens DSM 18772]
MTHKLLLLSVALGGLGLSLAQADEVPATKPAAAKKAEKEVKRKKVDVPEGYALAFATIGDVVEVSKGTYGYKLSYKIVETEATGIKNADGEAMKGPMVKYIYTEKNIPVPQQEVRVLYKIDEPIIYKVVDEVKLEKDSK